MSKSQTGLQNLYLFFFFLQLSSKPSFKVNCPRFELEVILLVLQVAKCELWGLESSQQLQITRALESGVVLWKSDWSKSQSVPLSEQPSGHFSFSNLRQVTRWPDPSSCPWADRSSWCPRCTLCSCLFESSFDGKHFGLSQRICWRAAISQTKFRSNWVNGDNFWVWTLRCATEVFREARRYQMLNV